MRHKRLPLLVGVALLFGCSFDYEGATVDEELAEEVPSSVLIKFSQTVVRDGRSVLVMEAEDARTFEEANTVVLTAAHFQELDEEGAVLVEGWAERATYHRDTENAEFQGQVRLYSAREETTLTAQGLTWDKENRLLRGEQDGLVVLKEDDGSEISGRGFEADFRYRRIRFTEGVTGTVVDE